MEWTGIRRRTGPTSRWYERHSRDGQYVARKVVSQYGMATRCIALKRDVRGFLTVVLGDGFRSLDTAMRACERDAKGTSDVLLLQA